MKTLILFYSLEGNTRLIAQSMAEAIGADIEEIKTEKDLAGGKGLGKYFWGGKQVMMKEKPAIKSLEKDPKDYDLIILGTPVWAGTFAPALRTFFGEHKFSGKKVALFYTCSSGPGGTIAKMKKELANNSFIGETGYVSPFKDKEKIIGQATDWAMSLIV
ncbi:MAG: flavodoxin [Patescibacteria group bacterium]